MTKKINNKILIQLFRIFVIPTTLLLFVDSCKKHGFGSVQGTVVDAYTGEPISNCEVGLCKAYHGNTCVPIITTTTDENGNFKISYFNNPNSNYELTISNKDAFKGFYFILSRRKSELSIKMPMKAFVKVIFKNHKTFTVYLNGKTSEDFYYQDLNEIISPNQTVNSQHNFSIMVGQPTGLIFTAKDINNNPVSINIDTTVLITRKLDTLIYTANIY